MNDLEKILELFGWDDTLDWKDSFLLFGMELLFDDDGNIKSIGLAE